MELKKKPRLALRVDDDEDEEEEVKGEPNQSASQMINQQEPGTKKPSKLSPNMISLA